MRRSAQLFTVTAFIALPLMAGGCVQQAKYDQLVMANRSLQEQLNATEEERDTAKANLEAVRQQLARSTEEHTKEYNAMQRRLAALESELQAMGGDYDELLRRLAGLDFGPLPEETTAALEALAAQHPDMLTFDAKRGMLRFASDFTFGLGSADLTSSAASSLTSLARILNSPAASNFEVRIVGHTDNVPISRPETKAKHPTNWYLSAHRAISVGNALMSSGVNPKRIQVAGCGEHRPVVANAPRGGAAQNRRVEIFLVPMSDLSAPMAAGQGTPSETSPSVAQPTRIDEPMK